MNKEMTARGIYVSLAIALSLFGLFLAFQIYQSKQLPGPNPGHVSYKTDCDVSGTLTVRDLDNPKPEIRKEILTQFPDVPRDFKITSVQEMVPDGKGGYRLP